MGALRYQEPEFIANVLARQQAKQAHMFEAILIKEGLVTEGAVSNVMVVRGGAVMTAQEGPRILSGVTRAVVLELARNEGLPIHERVISQAELYRADEVFLTGTTVEVLAVVRVDGNVIGDGRPGSITQRLATGFTKLVG